MTLVVFGFMIGVQFCLCFGEGWALKVATVVDEIVTQLVPQLATLLASGENWTLTLHGGRGGDVKVEVRTTAQLVTRTPGLLLEAMER